MSTRKTAKPTTAEETPQQTENAVTLPEPAALLTAAAENALSYLLGHTDGNPYYLAVGNAPEWAPTLGEWVGAHLEGATYSGPHREMTEPGKWNKKNIAGKTPNAEVRTWYAKLHRLQAATRHATGCDAMGWGVADRVAIWQPNRDDLYKVSTAPDPIASAITLATTTTTKTSQSADGLNRDSRQLLDGHVRALLKIARNGGRWGGTVADLAHDFTPEQIMSSVTRLTMDAEDAGKWRAAMAPVLGVEVPK
ncbi:hypothetical protein ABZ470_39945 [Streptosporangium sp. NPDC020072]|uniref:hypothetical protein n=1 Tax=Streptosporangium sp. NPDC020072 TaxID=3154788 RepID=UPI00342A8F18